MRWQIIYIIPTFGRPAKQDVVPTNVWGLIMLENKLVNTSVIKRSIVVLVMALFLLTPLTSLVIGVEIESLKMIEKNTGTAGSDLGWNVTRIGDINGDNSMDYAVGAPGYGSGDGRVYVFYGPLATINPSLASWTISGNSSQKGGFGWSIASCNDYNGDGRDDFIAQASDRPNWH